jgi:hypothetical protein
VLPFSRSPCIRWFTTHSFPRPLLSPVCSAPLSHVSTLVHAVCYDDVASADDLCLACCQLATHAAARQGPAEGLRVLAAGMARPKVAAVRSQAVNRRLRITQLCLQHDRALLRGDLRNAEALTAELAGEEGGRKGLLGGSC